MQEHHSSISKITRPRVSGILHRKRLFKVLDGARKKPVVWLSAPAGSGKTTLVASWLDARAGVKPAPTIWYQVDEGDADLATFFYYMGLAAKKAAPRYKKPLPLLTPEYLAGIPTFTRRYFENLYSRLISPGPSLPERGKSSPPLKKGDTGGFVLVLDNYQDASDPAFHEMMAHALDVIPDGIQVIVLSRADTPPQFSRLLANNKISRIGWEEIKFNLEETERFMVGANLCGRPKEGSHTGLPLQRQASVLHQQTEGWAAGMVLLMESAVRGRIEADVGLHTQQEIFDYFANEIFYKTDKAVQEMLLKTAFLNKIEPSTAEKLTGIAFAGQFLERLSRDNYFTQKYIQSYQYHPMFREFLLNLANAIFSQTELSHIRRNAAMLMAESGQIENAVLLFRDAGEWEGLTELLLKNAKSLIQAGRNKTLEQWLQFMPQDIINKTPWLLYWLGVCRLSYNPVEARGLFDKAYRIFKEENDAAGLFLSWSAAIDAVIYAFSDFSPMDKYIAEFEELTRCFPVFPGPEIEGRVTLGMFNALFWRQPRHTDLPMWAERLGRMALGSADLSMRIMLGNNLVMYHALMGDFPKAALIVDALRLATSSRNTPPMAMQWWYGMEAIYSWYAADHQGCLSAINSGMTMAEETGAHMFDFTLLAQGIFSGVSQEDLATARDFLERIARIQTGRLLDKCLYHHMASSVDWLKGALPGALEHGKLAVRFGEESGCRFSEAFCRMDMAITLYDNKQHEEAARELDRVTAIAGGLPNYDFICGLYRAWFAFNNGEVEKCVSELRQALAIGAGQGYVNFPRWSPRMMSHLSAVALERGIETEYVKMLIRKRNLLPEKSVENWPYPIKIYTLGRFEIWIDGKPVEFFGKVQKKPLEMLKAIIDMGGEDVPVERIADKLWPDAEGDMAHSSFEMTLSRLRKLIGGGSIELKGGMASLNPRMVWVDALVKKQE